MHGFRFPYFFLCPCNSCGVDTLAAVLSLQVWSGQLETLALQWAKQCVWSHGQPKTALALAQQKLGQTIWANNGRF